MKRIGAAAVAWAGDRLDIFGLGLDNGMFHKAWDGSTWLPSPTDWEPLGQTFTSPPAVAAWGPNRLDVFGLGPDRQMLHKAWVGSAWDPSPTPWQPLAWEPLGGVFTSPPAVAAWGPNRLDVFGLGLDRQLFHKAWDGSAWRPSPTDWEPLGGIFTSPPAVAAWGPNRLDVFGLGLDRQMYHRAWDGSAWKPEKKDGEWEALGGPFRTPPAVCSWGTDRLDLFAVSDSAEMFHKAWDRSWSPPAHQWEDLGGSFTSRPAAVAWGTNRLDAFGIGSDAQMYHKAWDGSWHPSQLDWESLGGIFTSAPAVVAWGPNRLDIFGLGLDDGMYHKAWDGGAWHPSQSGWEDLGGVFRLPSSVTRAPPATDSRWAVLLCKFTDDASEPSPRLFFEKLFTAAGSGLNNIVDFFSACSHGEIDSSRSDVYGWFTLNKRRSDYRGSGINPQGRQDLLNWAKQAATNAGVNLPNYAGVVVVMNVATDLYGGPGYAVCDLYGAQPSLVGQEMGHGYGLDHSRLDGSNVDYQDQWDIMSTQNAHMALDPAFGRVGPGLNAWNMRKAGWLEESRVWRMPLGSSDATVDLKPLHSRQLPGWLAAELPGGYLAEFRVKKEWDSAIPDDAVLIHRLAGGNSYLMKAQSGSVAMVAGDVFTATGSIGLISFPLRATVRAISPGASTATLRVQFPA